MEKFINREISWLRFNGRVLAQAMDPSNLLFERLKFLGIVSSNFDEFFMVRVASLKNAQDPILPEVRKVAGEMIQKQNRYFRSVMVPELKKAGIVRLTKSALNKKQKAFLKDLFLKELFPILTPIAISVQAPALVNLGLYLLIAVKEEWAVIEIPENFRRIIFLPADSGHPFVLVEDVIALFAEKLFVGRKIKIKGLMRITREAELTLHEEKDEDFSKVMTKALRKRRQSAIIRLEVSASADTVEVLKKKFKCSEDALCHVHSWVDLKRISELAFQPLFHELKSPTWHPKPHSEIEAAGDLWALLKQKDICLHHPYDSFDSVIRFVNDAADDPHVVAIKQTLYRTEYNSAFISALERASENGKRVTVLVELKARFNEEKNIKWAKRLEAAGVSVLYGIAGFKTHAKVCLVVRKEIDGVKRYVHLSTGNHNEKTARLYTDLGLFTSDESIADDVSAFFNVITGYSEPALFSKIEIAPYGLKKKLLKLIRRETLKGGSIIAKMNSLVDPDIIQALYKASNAGVQIRLNVRGICCLRPGIKNLSENIQVISIVDMFLEHSRIFHFSNGGKDELYLSSADWMPRNLERRIEIMFPIENPTIKSELISLLKLYFKDNTHSWRLLPTGHYARQKTNSTKFRVQSHLCAQALAREAQRKKSRLTELKPQLPQIKP